MNGQPAPPAWVLRRFLAWTAFAAASFLVFRGATLPPEEVPQILIRFNDRLVHGMEYFLLFLLAANAFRKTAWIWLTRFPYSLAFGYCLVMGILTETAQRYVPGRVPDIFDWASDGLGAAAGWMVILFTNALAGFISGKTSHELL